MPRARTRRAAASRSCRHRRTGRGPASGRDVAGNQVEHRGLAGAVRTDDAERLAVPDREVDRVYGLERAVSLDTLSSSQKGRHEGLLADAAAHDARRPLLRTSNDQEYLIGSNGLSSGMFGAVLLKTMFRSYLNFLPFFHWPPTSGVVQTFGTGLVGPPFHVIGPTSDW